MNCTACGTAIAEGAKFCGNCGKPIAASAAKKRGWPFWLKWIVITPLVLFAALMALGEWASLRQAAQYADEAGQQDPNSPIDADQAEASNDLPLPARTVYHLSQFMLGNRVASGLQRSDAAPGGSGVPAQGGPGLHKP